VSESPESITEQESVRAIVSYDSCVTPVAQLQRMKQPGVGPTFLAL